MSASGAERLDGMGGVAAGSMAGVTLAGFGLPRWDEFEAAYGRLVDDVHSRVVAWGFAPDSAVWEFPQPLWAERRGEIPAKARVREPSDWSRSMRYGFDDDGAIVCAQSFVSGSGPTVEMFRQTLVVWFGGQRLHLLYAMSPMPRLQSVVVEERAGDRLTGTTQFSPLPGDMRRERYCYDGEGRVATIVVHDVADMRPEPIVTWTEERVTYAKDGSVKRVSERKLKPGEGPARFQHFDAQPENKEPRKAKPSGTAARTEHFDVPQDNEEPVTQAQAQAARERLRTSLADAVVAWHARVDRNGEFTRILLLHDWPTNPPLPPGLAGRIGSWTSLGNQWEPFDPDPAGLLDAEPSEFDDDRLQADFDLLNAWYEQEAASPLELLIDVSQRAQSTIHKRDGHTVWVIPVDKDHEGLPTAIQTLLPPEVRAQITLSPEQS